MFKKSRQDASRQDATRQVRRKTQRAWHGERKCLKSEAVAEVY